MNCLFNFYKLFYFF